MSASVRYQDMKFDFLLFGEYIIYGAIANDIIRRSMGISKYCKTRLLLIDCSDDFILHAKEMTSESDVQVVEMNSQDFRDSIIEKQSDIMVTHTWPETLKFISSIPDLLKRTVLIDESPPLYDRFPKDIPYPRTLRDRVLSFKPARTIISRKYKRALKHALARVAISDVHAKVVKKFYGIEMDFVSYDPILSMQFHYTESVRKNIVVFNAKNEDVVKIVELVKLINQFTNGNIILMNSEIDVNIQYPHEKKDHYSNSELSETLASAYIAIIPERKGAFELVPIECIASGVPVISPMVPSLRVIDSHLSVDLKVPPYYDIDSLEYAGRSNFLEWIRKINNQRENFAKVIGSFFSTEHVAERFLEDLNRLLTKSKPGRYNSTSAWRQNQ